MNNSKQRIKSNQINFVGLNSAMMTNLCEILLRAQNENPGLRFAFRNFKGWSTMKSQIVVATSQPLSLVLIVLQRTA